MSGLLSSRSRQTWYVSLDHGVTSTFGSWNVFKTCSENDIVSQQLCRLHRQPVQSTGTYVARLRYVLSTYDAFHEIKFTRLFRTFRAVQIACARAESGNRASHACRYTLTSNTVHHLFTTNNYCSSRSIVVYLFIYSSQMPAIYLLVDAYIRY